MSLQQVKTATAGCCDAIYNAGVSSYATAHKYGKLALGGLTSGAKTVWAAASAFFGKMAVTIGSYLFAAKTAIGAGLSTAKVAFIALPLPAKIVGVASLAATAVTTALCCRGWNKNNEASAAAATGNAEAPALAEAPAPAVQPA